MQDFEFTVENGRLLMLQAGSGKRTPLAVVRIARDLAKDGLAVLKTLDCFDLGAIEVTRLSMPPDLELIATGASASTGVVVGAAVFDPERVTALRAP
jgi:pyruvate,orthophosphate dikinase